MWSMINEFLEDESFDGVYLMNEPPFYFRSFSNHLFFSTLIISKITLIISNGENRINDFQTRVITMITKFVSDKHIKMKRQ